MCGVELNKSNSIYTHYNTKLATCKTCYPIKRKHYDIKHKYKKYGLVNGEEEGYNELLEFQQGGCAICRKPCKTGDRLGVDHNHGTKEIRGLLCKSCNLAVSYLEDEDLAWKMMEYMKRTTWSKAS